MSDGSYVEALQTGLARPLQIDPAMTARIFVPEGWREDRREVPESKPPVVGTLTSLADFVKATALDAAVRHETFVHVQDPEHVAFRSSVEVVDGRYRRNTLLVATIDMVGRPAIQFGNFYDPEHFVVGLQAWFVVDDTQKSVLAAVGNIRDSAVTTAVDDGVTQEVIASRGVMVARAALPSPVVLRPYRTFREVAQPASQFILRARPGKEGQLPTLALFEADGMAWKLEAMKNVAEYLRKALPGATVLA